MDKIPPIPLSNSPAQSRERKANSDILQNKTVQSSDFIIRRGTFGTFLELKPRHKRGVQAIEWAGEFDPSASYYPNQEVRITSGSITQYPFLSGSIGVWRCCVAVPDQAFSDAFIAEGLDQTQYPGYVRQPGVVYFPIRPEPSVTASVSESNGRYWEDVGGLASGTILARFCDLNDPRGYSDWYLYGYRSGSAP